MEDKLFYLAEITRQLQNCNDLTLIIFIYKLLQNRANH